jgi:hypothetical protein
MACVFVLNTDTSNRTQLSPKPKVTLTENWLLLKSETMLGEFERAIAKKLLSRFQPIKNSV